MEKKREKRNLYGDFQDELEEDPKITKCQNHLIVNLNKMLAIKGFFLIYIIDKVNDYEIKTKSYHIMRTYNIFQFLHLL